MNNKKTQSTTTTTRNNKRYTPKTVQDKNMKDAENFSPDDFE